MRHVTFFSLLLIFCPVNFYFAASILHSMVVGNPDFAVTHAELIAHLIGIFFLLNVFEWTVFFIWKLSRQKRST